MIIVNIIIYIIIITKLIIKQTICTHNDYLRSQLDTYKTYIENIRSKSGPQTTKGKEKKKKQGQQFGPIKYTHSQLEKEGIIVESNVPENRRANIFFNITSPIPGSFVIELHYKGIVFIYYRNLKQFMLLRIKYN